MARACYDDKKICDLIAQSPPGEFSEYFPPKTGEGVKNLKKRIVRMPALSPLFTDFTWGAGGSTSERSITPTAAAKNEFGCVANIHPTCTTQKTEMCVEALDACRKVGVRNIVQEEKDDSYQAGTGYLITELPILTGRRTARSSCRRCCPARRTGRRSLCRTPASTTRRGM